MAKLRRNRLSGFPRCLWFSNQHKSFWGERKTGVMPCIRFTSYGYVSCAQNQVSYYCCIGGSRPEHLNPSLMLEEEQGFLREHHDWPLLATLSLFPFPPLYLLSGSKVQGCHEALSHLCWKAISFSGSNGLCSPLSTLAPPARNK